MSRTHPVRTEPCTYAPNAEWDSPLLDVPVTAFYSLTPDREPSPGVLGVPAPSATVERPAA